MSPDARSQAIHATAVSIGGLGLLIRGPSKAGKSRLALALIDASTSALPIRLVGDDRVLVTSGPGQEAIVRPHPRIAGFIERRGLGIVAVSYAADAPIVGIVALCEPADRPDETDLENFPVLSIVESSSVEDRRDLTLRWFAMLASDRKLGRDKQTTPVLENTVIGQTAIKD